MKRYIDLEELRDYIFKLRADIRITAASARAKTLEDSETAQDVFLDLFEGEAQDAILEEVEQWADGNAVTGALILPTLGGRGVRRNIG